ncbi:DedA family protein [Lapillicoccus sp.]|uniref:DedA family protein n=1 Tax=Lapillicoccus sp. TaxID=1909287 RepID=UPI0025DA6691|nr:DedA family protein [Lapillicoccus sp.]
MSSLVSGILNLSPILIYLIVGLLVFAEDAIFIGFVIPGETAAVLGGVSASTGQTVLAVVMIIVVVAAIAGDSVGYEVGKHIFGPHIVDSKFLAKHRHKLNNAENFLQERGGSAIFLGRFVAFFRAMMPALAGAAGMPYRRFLPWNAAGGLVWGSVFVVLGYVAGNSYAAIEAKVGRGLAIGVAAVVIIAIIVWRVRSERSASRDEREYAEEQHRAGDVTDDLRS